MGIFNELGEGGLNNSLSKRLSIAGGAPSPALEPGIFPTLSLGVAWEELAFNQGWRRWQYWANQASVAAQAPRFLLVNRAAGVLVVIEQVLFSSDSTIRMGQDHGYATLAALGTLVGQVGEFRDSRQTPSGGGALEISNGTSAAILTPTGARIRVPADTTVAVPGGPWLLWGTGHLLFGASTADLGTQIDMIVVWSERPMTRGELLG